MRCLSILLTLVLSAAPALAQQPVRDSAGRHAERSTAQQAETARAGKSFWPGIALAAAGSMVAILGATAFKSEQTTSGNTPPNGFDSCEALRANRVYAGNACDVLKGPNLGMVWGGVAAASLGVALMAVGAPRSSIQLAPGGVRIQHRVKF